MRKTKLFFFLLFQCWCLASISQRRDETKIIKDAGEITESFEGINYYKNSKAPFRDIIVVDKRFDTTKLGYTNSDFKILLGRSWSSVLNNYFKNNLEPSSDKSLVIFIKSYWLQRGIIDKVVKKRIILKDAFGSNELNLRNGGSCSANIEVFAKSSDHFQALFRIDTFFLNTITNFRKNKLADFFFLPFDSVFRKMATTDVTDLLDKRKKIVWNELTEHYDNRFDLPVCKEPYIKKGIFFTFEDFKKNKPAETAFRLQQGNVSDELYMGVGQEEQLVADYWGFFDGNSLYIKAGFSAFKAVRQQCTFEIFGALHVSNYHDNPVPGGININSTEIDRKILQVNMDTGGFF